MHLKKVVPALKHSGVSNGYTLEYTSSSTQCGRSKTSNSINSSPPVSTLALSCPHQKGNTTALLRPAKLGRGLGSEPGQTMSYCTWGFEAKDSVPKSSGPTHTPGSYQSSAITTFPAVASGCDRGHCQPSTNSSARLRNKPKSSLL